MRMLVYHVYADNFYQVVATVQNTINDMMTSDKIPQNKLKRMVYEHDDVVTL